MACISEVYGELTWGAYWISDALGQPFFSIERPIDHGLLEVLRSDIVPRLFKDVPSQPTAQQLEADRYGCTHWQTHVRTARSSIYWMT